MDMKKSVVVESCHRKWRQIGTKDVPNQEESEASGGKETEDLFRRRSTMALNSAVEKIRLVTLFPQIANFLRRHPPENSEKDDIDACHIESAMGNLFMTHFIPVASFLFDSGRIGTFIDPLTIPFDISRRQDEILSPNMENQNNPTNLEKNAEESGISSYKKLVLFLKRDKSQCQFLRELLKSKHLIYPSSDTLSELSVVPLLKRGLKGRYGSHVKDALRKQDLQALICILSIVAQSGSEEIEEVNEDSLHLNSIAVDGSSTDLQSVQSGWVVDDHSISSPSESLSKFFQDLVLDADSECRPDEPDDSKSDDQPPRPSTKPQTTSPLSTLTETTQREIATSSHLKCWVHQIMSFLHKHPLLKEGILEFNRRRPSPGEENTIEDISPALLQFLQCMETIKKHMMISNAEDSYSADDLDKINNLTVEKRVLEIKEMMEQLRETSAEECQKLEYNATERAKEIERMKRKLTQVLDGNEEIVFHTVRHLEEEKVIADKRHNQKLANLHYESADKKERLIDALVLLDGGYDGLRNYRKGLENELRMTIEEYDASVTRQQGILDELRGIEEECEEETKCLQKIYSVIEEKYDEMRNTRRLKELLKSLQMAESVRENWAARRIQMAWKRYKTNKLKKRRLKKPKKKKASKKGEDAQPSKKSDNLKEPPSKKGVKRQQSIKQKK